MLHRCFLSRILLFVCLCCIADDVAHAAPLGGKTSQAVPHQSSRSDVIVDDKSHRDRRPIDFYVVSFPASGRAWLRDLLVTAFLHHHNDLTYRKTALASKSWPPLHNRHCALPRLSFRHFFDAPANADEWSVPTVLYNQSVLLLVRDPRQTAFSLYFERKHQRDCSFTKYLDRPLDGKPICSTVAALSSIDDADRAAAAARLQRTTCVCFPSDYTLSDFLRESNTGLLRNVAYLRAFDAARSTLQQLFVVRYEDLLRNPHRVLQQVLLFFGQTRVSAASIDRAIALTHETTLAVQNTSRWAAGGLRRYLRGEPHLAKRIDRVVTQSLPRRFGYTEPLLSDLYVDAVAADVDQQPNDVVVHKVTPLPAAKTVLAVFITLAMMLTWLRSKDVVVVDVDEDVAQSNEQDESKSFDV